MSFFKKKKILVTHNGTFHADDIFATATLSIMLDGNIKVLRTRDEDMFKKADYLYDVGGEYNPSRNRFDHHQKGGAGKRENGVPYAAFGLVWKTYGEIVCGSLEVVQKIDETLVQAIDAGDNGIDLYKVIGTVAPFQIENIFSAFRPSWKEPEEYGKPFMELVSFARKFLIRKIKKVTDALEAESIVKKAYEDAVDKRLIVLDDNYPWEDVIMAHPEPLYVVGPKAGTWRLFTVKKEKKSFENRKSLPQAWAGLRDEEFAKVTGVPDATFCHNGRFLAVVKSKEGAIALAKMAVLA